MSSLFIAPLRRCLTSHRSQVTKEFRRGFATEKGSLKTFSPEAERVKSFKPVVAGYIIFTAATIGLELYSQYWLPQQVEVSERTYSKNHTQWALVQTALTNITVNDETKFSLAAIQQMSKEGVVEKGMQQLTIAIKDVTEVGNHLKTTKDQKENIVKLYQSLWTTISTIQSALADFAILEANAKKIIEMGILDKVAIVYKLHPDPTKIAHDNYKLFYTLKQHAELAPEVSKYDYIIATITPEEEKTLSVGRNAIITDIKKWGPKFILLGAIGVIYCYKRWSKFAIPKNILNRKLIYAFVGCSVSNFLSAAPGLYTHSIQALNAANDNISGKTVNRLYSPPMLNAANFTGLICSAAAFIISWYNCKFIVFPSIFGVALVKKYFKNDSATTKLDTQKNE